MSEVERPRQLGVSHLGLSVTDLTRSTAFYREVLGAQVIYPRHHSDSFSGHRTVVRLGPHAIDLNQFSDNEGTKFDPTHTGLDHLAFVVASREDLEIWARWLDANDVARSAVRDVRADPTQHPGAPIVGAMFDFIDPDGIQLEFLFFDEAKSVAPSA